MRSVLRFLRSILAQWWLLIGLVVFFLVAAGIGIRIGMPLFREDAAPGEMSVDQWLDDRQWLWEAIGNWAIASICGSICIAIMYQIGKSIRLDQNKGILGWLMLLVWLIIAGGMGMSAYGVAMY